MDYDLGSAPTKDMQKQIDDLVRASNIHTEHIVKLNLSVKLIVAAMVLVSLINLIFAVVGHYW